MTNDGRQTPRETAIIADNEEYLRTAKNSKAKADASTQGRGTIFGTGAGTTIARWKCALALRIQIEVEVRFCGIADASM